jgi:hypothetical protein
VEDKVSGEVVPICQQERLQLEVVAEEIAQQVEMNLVLQAAQDLFFFGIRAKKDLAALFLQFILYSPKNLTLLHHHRQARRRTSLGQRFHALKPNLPCANSCVSVNTRPAFAERIVEVDELEESWTC